LCGAVVCKSSVVIVENDWACEGRRGGGCGRLVSCPRWGQRFSIFKILKAPVDFAFSMLGRSDWRELSTKMHKVRPHSQQQQGRVGDRPHKNDMTNPRQYKLSHLLLWRRQPQRVLRTKNEKHRWCRLAAVRVAGFKRALTHVPVSYTPLSALFLHKS
jgi:hypothetical protein